MLTIELYNGLVAIESKTTKVVGDIYSPQGDEPFFIGSRRPYSIEDLELIVNRMKELQL